ncbi:MAG: lipid-A-disaccharide synthase [Lentisphaerae bacterium RIFOXYC12_FULL_60_16]|nr:MAG: lipid-A-disaccharide synthase [Lentisphaerae bacterium RIFOXYC12_FULL_60_16]OGV72670.1 MAG: lipid-A-disaccharide synthase [Lentisphaerae bacterium RIFOXYA12_FULL_60_10]OGV86141.1 MAG: lipid-A-disaccharide synthase [Lentisphaerae bacterium RIFOXYB12_FULL_60_10]
MPRSPIILIIAGEASGDLHAGNLVSALKTLRSDILFTGIGGANMRQAGVNTLHDISQMAVMGFVEVIRRYGFFRRVFNETVQLARDKRPDLVILVDYPGFNLRLAAVLHAMGIPVVYYICPQVWAWHQSRIPGMARIIDRLITIFPFEAPHFAGTPLVVDYVGHPLVDITRDDFAQPSPDFPWQGSPRLALLPGSRRQEIERILPSMTQAAMLLTASFPGLACIVAAPDETIAGHIRDLLKRTSPLASRFAIVAGQTRQVVRTATAALVASGTATLETALMKCPMVITYRMAPLSFAFAKRVVQLDHIGMVNIIANRRICPERIQSEATPTALASAVEPLLTDTPERRAMLEGFEHVRNLLGEGGASKRAATIILDLLESRRAPTPPATSSRHG